LPSKGERSRAAAAVLLAIAALYLAVWPHELGHSTTAYLLGCKLDWWRTATTWYLWNSRAGDVDYACLERRPGASLLTEGAGIAVNLSLLAAAVAFSRTSWAGRSPWLLLGALLAALSNYAEAFSYLVLNVLWLKSDMAAVVAASGVSRWLWLAFGSALATAAGYGLAGPARRAAELLQTPEHPESSWRAFFVGYVSGVALTMATARILLA
jgi:hypothetical protein